MSGSRIKAIDTTSVHRIHSGQVVLDLQGAIKELVENSLDAGATSVEVRIKDNGLESIEVVDNGSGIDKEDWPAIALKHHTSKLPSLEELANVSTFGFRGEALSALCALCESVTVTTATKETAPMGAVISLGRDGRVLDDTGRVARQRGTTVSLVGLFRPLPVRRKEFERTAKREFTKALGILNAYALVPASASPGDGRPGVRLRVESVGAGRSGKRSTVLSTDGRGALRSSITAVWGPKALEGVVDIDLEVNVEVDKAMARREGISDTHQTVRVCGLISSGAWGQGRSSTDRQFTYINGRPCMLPKIVKAVNEVYRSFNTNQSPLAILDFQIPKESVDINVSPDKRTIFVHSEANLIEALRTELENFFQPSRSTYAVAGASTTVKVLQTQNAHGDETDGEDEAELPDGDDLTGTSIKVAEDDLGKNSEEDSQGGEPSRPLNPSRRVHSALAPTLSGTLSSAVAKAPVVQQTLDTTVASWSSSTRRVSERPSRSSAPAVTPAPPASGRKARTNLRQRLAGYASQQIDLTDDRSEPESEEDTLPPNVDDNEDEEVDMLSQDGSIPEPASSPVQTPAVMEQGVVVDQIASTPSPAPEPVDSLDDVVEEAREPPERSTSPDQSSLTPIPNAVADLNGMDVDEVTAPSGYRDEIQFAGRTGAATLQFNMSRLRKRMSSRRTRRQEQPENTRSAARMLAQGAITKAAGVQNRDAGEAEAALARVIRKDDFAQMEVLGQFNKGFIIARLRHGAEDIGASTASDDLFIVDQHASDEKYNFETLQRTTVIKSQALIRPRPMQLTAADEIVAMENMSVLQANGFDVNVDEDAPPGRGERISLRAMPVSKETTFDFNDLEQLLHLLSDSARPSGQMVRCTKARSMFAMRACRRSVMIGKSLTKTQMVALLRNMGTIDQPWNCPHGRPTMRHLCSLNTISRSCSGANRIDWSQWEP